MYGILQPSHYTDTGQGSFDMAKAFSDFTMIYLTEKVTRWLTGPISVGVVLLVFLLRIRNEHEKRSKSPELSMPKDGRKAISGSW